MSVRQRLFILVVLLATLPALAASLLSRQLIRSTFDTSLSTQIDQALEAGLQRAQAQLSTERSALRAHAETWAEEVDAQLARGVPLDADDLRAQFSWTAGDEDRVEVMGRGSPIVLQAGRLLPSTSDGPAPPDRLRVERALQDGRVVVVQRAVDASWQVDAAAIANGLQLARALQIERERIGREFWMPFLVIYGLSLFIGLIAAWSLSRGLTQPLSRLVHATQKVGAGEWSTQVELRGGGELEQVSNSFNRMVTTLDAQNRRLVDLETMAGWREMARALAHEVKNPLTPIQLTVEEMLAQYKGDDAEYRRLLEECTRIVVEEVESLRNVVGRFREFSRPVELRLQAQDLNQLLRDLGALQKDLQVEFELDPALDERPVPADADRLRQLLINLAENARQAQADSPRPPVVGQSHRR